MAAAPSEFAKPPCPNLMKREILHVDEAAWSCHLRVAPSRTSPVSAVKSQDPSFEETALHDRPPRREFIPSSHAGSRKGGFTRRLLTAACSRFQPIGVRQAPLTYPPPDWRFLLGIFNVLPHELLHPADVTDSCRGGFAANSARDRPTS